MFFAQRSVTITQDLYLMTLKHIKCLLIQEMCSWYGFEEIDRGDNKICLEKKTA
jgi:hypothetical protein